MSSSTVAFRNESEIDAVLSEAVARGAVHGVVAMAATSGGQVYAGAFGGRDVAGDRPVAVDSIFRIASMTKAITAVAVMQLVELGKLALDDDLLELLPELASVQVLAGFEESGRPRFRDAASRLSVRHLITHTSGFGYEIWNRDLLRLQRQGGLASIFEDGRGFLLAPLLFDPGDRWEYGIGFDWLGVLVEAVSGQRLDDYFRQHIFEPLDMRDSRFLVPAGEARRLVTACRRLETGELLEVSSAAPSAARFCRGGDGLYSTGPDYLRFLQAMLRRGALGSVRLLEPRSVDLMCRNQIGDLEAGRMKSAIPKISADADFFRHSTGRFGLGFLLNTEPLPGGRSAMSAASAGLFNTHAWLDFEAGVCGLVMLQILPFFDGPCVELLQTFERSIYAAVGESRRG